MMQTQEITQNNFKIAIVITLKNEDGLKVLYPYLKAITQPYRLHLLLPTSTQLTVEEDFETVPTHHTFKDQEEYYRTLFQLLKILYDENQYICFLNPKFTHAINKHERTWFDLSVKPLLASQKVVNGLITHLNNEKNFFIASAELYTSAQNLHNDEAPFLCSLLTGFGVYEPSSDWGSLLSENFWIHSNGISLLLKYQSIFFNALHLLQNNSRLHFVTFVTLCLKQHRKNITLSYACDALRDVYFYDTRSQKDNTKYANFDLETLINQTMQSQSNYTIIAQSDQFIQEDYLQQTSWCTPNIMDPLLHFIRYGVYEDLAPSTSFSPFMYISMYPDSFKSGENPLCSAIIHQRTISMSVNIDYSEHKQTIAASGLFDLTYYKEKNSDVNIAKIDHFSHYCFRGWEEERKPNPHFDAIWYKSTYLSDYLLPINALLHYILLGRLRGHRVRPYYTSPKPIEIKPYLSKPRRITLFAAYDAEGIIDDVVLEYITELSRHSDLYFLSDFDLNQQELDKLKGIAKGAWGIRHGEYDFGSYKRLAKYLVGWKKLQEYDEILLVNDSSYLLRPLDDVFEKMSKKSCSWWGMQASKGIYETRHEPSNQYEKKISIETIKNEYLEKFEEDSIYDFHIGSYFLVFRQPVIESGFLENFLKGVKKQANKKNIILSYEIGLTRALINKGYTFDTYIDYLYPFHPLYTNTIFTMIDEGYPFFKRFLLTRNHYRAPELWRWKDKVLHKYPHANVLAMQDNLDRVSTSENLRTNLYIPLAYHLPRKPKNS